MSDFPNFPNLPPEGYVDRNNLGFFDTANLLSSSGLINAGTSFLNKVVPGSGTLVNTALSAIRPTTSPVSTTQFANTQRPPGGIPAGTMQNIVRPTPPRPTPPNPTPPRPTPPNPTPPRPTPPNPTPPRPTPPNPTPTGDTGDNLLPLLILFLLGS